MNSLKQKIQTAASSTYINDHLIYLIYIYIYIYTKILQPTGTVCEIFTDIQIKVHKSLRDPKKRKGKLLPFRTKHKTIGLEKK
jgi:hypothetical protein